ncbi:MAG: aspartate aminotransferase family protein [Clostridia bacterium]|nr:aspartate aminotransferase family protein [Clostridia bacterium]
MNLEEIKLLDCESYMNTFGERTPVAFEKGEGMKLYATDGRVFNDFLGGIAVNALGHSHPILKEALHTQVDKLLHTSNLYYIENQAKLAKKLKDSTCMDRVFFASTGAEANEGAIKLAKIYHHKKGTGRYGVVSLDKSFHGRTIATVAATGQEKYQAPYRPLPDGFIQVPANDFEALKEASKNACAILLEPIQGEGGVRPLDLDYLKKVREFASENDIVLIFDEVQTGMGRCGELYCYMTTGVEPDVLTSAKALGGGVPIGAVLAKEKFASAFNPGDHGTTFGGNPLACAAGLAVFEAFEKENLVENAKEMGEYFISALNSIKSDKIAEIRGRGLLIGIEIDENYAKAVFTELFQEGYLTSLCGGTTIRIAPPLIITKADIDRFISVFTEILERI